MSEITLLQKVKDNLVLEHNADDALVGRLVAAAKKYAEKYQHMEAGYYDEHEMSPLTEEAVIMMATFFYESRDGATGGFYSNMLGATEEMRTTVNMLLSMEKDWVM